MNIDNIFQKLINFKKDIITISLNKLPELWTKNETQHENGDTIFYMYKNRKSPLLHFIMVIQYFIEKILISRNKK